MSTLGEKKLYEKFKGQEVRAIRGHSDRGYGWRPVCAGQYVGAECLNTEKLAIANGVAFIAKLSARVESAVEETPKKPSRKGKKGSIDESKST